MATLSREDSNTLSGCMKPSDSGASEWLSGHARAGSISRCEGDTDEPLVPEADATPGGVSPKSRSNVQQASEQAAESSLDLELARAVQSESGTRVCPSGSESSSEAISNHFLDSAQGLSSWNNVVNDGAHQRCSLTEPATSQRPPPEASEVVRYNVQACGEIYSLLHCHKTCTQSLGARIVLDTPLLHFLSPSDLSNAASVCKLWWAELYSPQKMQWFFAVPGNQQVESQQPPRLETVRFMISSARRPIIWRLALLGEFENYNGQLYDALEEYVELADNNTKGSFLCRHAGSRPCGKQALDSDDRGDSTSAVPPVNVSSDPGAPALTPRSINEMLNNDGLIRRDIDRTFPHRPLFSRIQNSITGNSDDLSTAWVTGQHWLYRMLSYVALSRELSVGYCQGMNFIAGVFLETFDCNLQLATRCFNAFLQRKDIRSILGPELLEAQAVCADLDNLVAFYLPALATHFASWNLTAVTYALQWVVTFFAYDMAVASVVLIWDQLFIGGLSIVLQVILGLLHRHEENLLALPFEECLRYLKGITASVKLRIEDLNEFSLRFSMLHPYSPQQYIHLDSPAFQHLRSMEGSMVSAVERTGSALSARQFSTFGRPLQARGEPGFKGRRNYLLGLNPVDVGLCCSPKVLDDDAHNDIVVAFKGPCGSSESAWRRRNETCGSSHETGESIGEFEVGCGEDDGERSDDEAAEQDTAGAPRVLAGGLAYYVFAACQDPRSPDSGRMWQTSQSGCKPGSQSCDQQLGDPPRKPGFAESATGSELSDWSAARMVGAAPSSGGVPCPRPFRAYRRSLQAAKSTSPGSPLPLG